MQGWVVGAVWAGVVVFAIIVLGFATYEVTWKARRLDSERIRLQLLVKHLAAIAQPPVAGQPRGAGPSLAEPREY